MADPIRHVVLLMLENRSFDHMLGALPHLRDHGVDPDRPGRNRRSPATNDDVSQAPRAVRKLKPGPGHEPSSVLRQIDGPDGLGPMGGFAYDYSLRKGVTAEGLPQVLAYFEEGSLPALHELARAFTVCSPWFASVPGPTWPNRFFALSGTSQGISESPSPPYIFSIHHYDQPTIFDRLNERGVPWRVYVGDIPFSLLLRNQRRRESRRGYRRLSSFFEDLATEDEGSFPSFVLLEPHYFFGGQNDQHPPSDVLRGDELIASVYNALRRNERVWNGTLLVITYDEHGGFYDHVVPPNAIPPDHKSEDGFRFNRYGVRVPTLLVSKWVGAGQVFTPDPKRDKWLDHTSLIRYLSDKYELGPLGRRSAEAASIAPALSASENVDAPLRVGVQPRPLEISSVGGDLPDSLNTNQAALIEFSRQLELEMDVSLERAGRRALRSAAGVEQQVEVAKERVWDFIEQAGAPQKEER